jgi:hypothetical protein
MTATDTVQWYTLRGPGEAVKGSKGCTVHADGNPLGPEVLLKIDEETLQVLSHT